MVSYKTTISRKLALELTGGKCATRERARELVGQLISDELFGDRNGEKMLWSDVSLWVQQRFNVDQKRGDEVVRQTTNDKSFLIAYEVYGKPPMVGPA